LAVFNIINSDFTSSPAGKGKLFLVYNTSKSMKKRRYRNILNLGCRWGWLVSNTPRPL